MKAARVERDQLLAEAVHLLRTGEQWWLQRSEVSLSQESQEARYAGDAWEQKVSDYLVDKDQVTVGEVLQHAIGLEIGRWGQSEQNRVAKVLKRLGWRRTQRLVEGKKTWVYVPDPIASGDTGDTDDRSHSQTEGTGSCDSTPSPLSPLSPLGSEELSVRQNTLPGSAGLAGESGARGDAEPELAPMQIGREAKEREEADE